MLVRPCAPGVCQTFVREHKACFLDGSFPMVQCFSLPLQLSCWLLVRAHRCGLMLSVYLFLFCCLYTLLPRFQGQVFCSTSSSRSSAVSDCSLSFILYLASFLGLWLQSLERGFLINISFAFGLWSASHPLLLCSARRAGCMSRALYAGSMLRVYCLFFAFSCAWCCCCSFISILSAGSSFRVPHLQRA